jgi:hypothetical protein
MTGYALFLCNRTMAMPRPWLEAGIACVTVDLLAADEKHPLREHMQCDVGHYNVGDPPIFVAAFPPCTDLAVSGARWYRGKGLSRLITALETVEICRTICEAANAPYMIENPVGTLSTYWRNPDYSFDPCDYGDPYTKKTLLWTGGGFVMPPVVRPRDLFESATWVEPTRGSMMHLLSPSPDRRDLRSVTPQGFARAVFEANRPGLLTDEKDAA